MPAVQNPPAQAAPADAGSTAKGAPAPPPVPFVRAALEKVQRAKQWQHTVELSTETQPLPTLTIPAHGFLRRVLIRLTIDQMTGGTYGLDGLSNGISSVNFADTGGSDVIVPLSGSELQLVNKWVPTVGVSDPALLFPNPLDKWLYLPLEISPRDALGSLPNMDQSSLYTADVTVGRLADIFDPNDLPNAAPNLTLRAYTESWSPPQPGDFGGRSVEPQPPALNTTQYVSKHRKNIQGPGDDAVTLERRGNLIRSLIIIGRDSDGNRSNDVLPESFRFTWDGREMYDMDTDLQRHLMRERSGMAVDTGVVVLDWTHEFDGRIGAELRDQWLRSMKSSTMTIDLLGMAEAGQITILTVDVAPEGNVYVG